MKHHHLAAPGTVYLIGAGPGAPELLTIKGASLLKSCDAVVYDHLASEELLELTPKHCRRIFAGKEAGHHSMPQEEINDCLIRLAGEGLGVVRLKGGDPFVFGRGSEEILALQRHNIPWEIIPGITSAVAVPELAGIPVTHRKMSRSFHVITGHTLKGLRDEKELAVYAKLEGTLVFLMGFHSLSVITQGLIQGGKRPSTPAAVIENGSLPQQRVLRATLETLAGEAERQGFHTPAIIIVGETAAFDLTSDKKTPFADTGALDGLTAGLIGTGHFIKKLEAALHREGARAETLLCMEVLSEEGKQFMGPFYRRLQEYTWLVLTSVNGVELFFQGLFEAGLDLRSLGHMKFAVIGAATGEALMARGIRADQMPKEYCCAHLAASLRKVLIPGKDRVLMARAQGASRDLNHMLDTAGISYDDVPLYTVKGRPELKMHQRAAGCDTLIFASPSGVEEFQKAGGFQLSHQHLTAIGPVTAAAVQKAAQRPADLVSSSYHIPGLIAALKEAKGRG